MLPENRRERFTTYAETLHRRFQTGILADLQERPLWVVWKPEKDQQGNIHKRPFTPRGYPASIYKPRQWASIDTALEALSTGNFAGIGVMLPAPLVLIDKDAKPDAPVYDPEKRKIVSPLALRLLQNVPSYAELSPHNGLHIITEGIAKRGNFKTEQLELYTNWFSTVTTRHIQETPLTVTNQQPVGRLSRPWPLLSTSALTAKWSATVSSTAAQSMSSISCSVPPPFAFASPHEGRGISVPALGRLLQPLNNLLWRDWVLSV